MIFKVKDIGKNEYSERPNDDPEISRNIDWLKFSEHDFGFFSLALPGVNKPIIVLKLYKYSEIIASKLSQNKKYQKLFGVIGPIATQPSKPQQDWYWQFLWYEIRL